MANPAALQGWVKSADPKTGRTFYANHITRVTQWDPPEGWVDEPQLTPPRINDNKGDGEEEPLPSNWEVMHDPTTGKPFYVDHERKITTWTRPKPEKHKPSMSLQPASPSPSSGNASSAALSRILASQQQPSSSATATRTARSGSGSFGASGSIGRSYQQEVAYYASASPSSMSRDADFSDALPALDFTVQKVADAYRPVCPHCQEKFTMGRRRHHCRLCGDVFCDACSSHRVNLPLQGAEFEKAVRVCDFCNEDVERGNFFSMRRYLTPLHLYEPNSGGGVGMNLDSAYVSESSSHGETGSGGGVATAANVNAALSALTLDVDQMVQTGTLEDNKLTIPADVLIPVICKHLEESTTADRAVRAIASLLALESVAASSSDANMKDFSVGVYLYGKKKALEHILSLLERSGSDRKTLFVQEQAARTLCYLTEGKIIIATIRKHAELDNGDEFDNVEALDIHRAIRNMIDHSSNSNNPNLQRWSTACVKNLILEDQRRACLAMNDVAAVVASGEDASSLKLEYESFLGELVSSGGVMILCSLIGADDADTRAHAVGALGAILTSTRAINSSTTALSEMTGGSVFGQSGQTKDGDIVRAIVAGGGCASSVSQLLISADHGVAGMGCTLIASLVMPLLSTTESVTPQYDFHYDQGGMGACREASIEIATGPCLPALLSLVRESVGVARPIELRKVSMETLAAVVVSVGEMGQSWAQGKYEEGLERAGAPRKLKEALVLLNEEGAIDAALEVLQSSSGQSLGSARETPSSRIREAAGMVLGSLTSFSADAIMELQNRKILSSLLLSSNDASMTVPSTLRSDGAPRCLGVLEAASSILMFAWQHPSGASSELLDRLIEVIDAGAIPYLSKVLNAKVDWESKEKGVGGMRGRVAACKFLCCAFGIALTDETGIGMRRLMDAVATDARAYRGGERAPSNIIEAALATLSTASAQARKVVMGSGGFSSQYQAAVTALVDAALLSAGSMCGSSVAPGGSEGTLITGESFLASRSDEYVARRKEICTVACDVIVRGGRAGPALLPTLLVGGFGADCVQSALRLAVSIGQNGSAQEHQKLATCGIMVPVSDLLAQALSRGELYNFSAALALLRCCGPHVAAGQSGGLESVRDAIRVATSVLTLPLNPEATLEQIETQEALKSECIAALEALSRNAGLWNCISTEALPSIVRYLHSTVGMSPSNPQRQKTRCGALRAVLQIVQVPSHAVSAAKAGLTEPLGQMLEGWNIGAQEDEMPMLALEVIHVISANQEARQGARFIQTGLLRSICAALSKAATDQPKKPSDSRADVTFLGLEILNHILSDVERDFSIQELLQKQESIAIVDAFASEPGFVRAMLATLLLKTQMRIQRHDGEGDYLEIPKNYGPPLILVPEKCGSFDNTHDAAASMLYKVAVFAVAIESQRCDAFWKTVLLQDLPQCDATERLQASAAMCAHFLALLTADYKPFLPTASEKKAEYVSVTRPLVRYRLLEALKDAMNELSEESSYGPTDPYVTSLFVGFNVPHICLSLWKDPALLDPAFELIKHIVEQDPDEVLHLFVEGEAAMMSLFDLLNLDSTVETSKNVTEIRRFLASVLGQLAENGLLAEAVQKYDVRSSAIAALAAACLSEEERNPDDDEDTTSNRLSAVLMRCLVELCTVKEKDGSGVGIQLSPSEANAIANNLGKKICHMVLSRFLERAKLQQYELDEDEKITDAPDVAMLCAVAQHEEALLTLRSIGGLHALSLIAAEGEVSALTALKKACSANADVLLEGETFDAMMNLVSADSKDISWKDAATRSVLEASAFELLASLITGSRKGRSAVAASKKCDGCVTRAVELVSDLVSSSQEEEEENDDEPAEPHLEDTIVDAKQVKDAADESALKDMSCDDIDVVVAACSFLSALASTKMVRKVLDSGSCIEALCCLARADVNPELAYAASRLLVSLSPSATSTGPLSSEKLSVVLGSVLESEKKIGTSSTLNANRMYQVAVSGLVVIFDAVDTDTQRGLASVVAKHFTQSVKRCVVTRSTTTDDDRVFSAELSYELTVALLLARGKEFVDEIFTSELVTSMIHLVQWRYDPKTSFGKTHVRSWNASVANCLLLISILVWRPDEVLVKAGISVDALSSTTLMLARPGKAPRRAIDLKSALNTITEEGGKNKDGDSAASSFNAAQRILERLY